MCVYMYSVPEKVIEANLLHRQGNIWHKISEWFTVNRALNRSIWGPREGQTQRESAEERGGERFILARAPWQRISLGTKPVKSGCIV